MAKHRLFIMVVPSIKRCGRSEKNLADNLRIDCGKKNLNNCDFRDWEKKLNKLRSKVLFQPKLDQKDFYQNSTILKIVSF